MKITLCGSARFSPDMAQWHRGLALAGHIVYGMTLATLDRDPWPDEKWKYDLIHFAKIEESDAIVVMSNGGHVEASTEREIYWAVLRRKAVYFAESQPTIGSLVIAANFDDWLDCAHVRTGPVMP